MSAPSRTKVHVAVAGALVACLAAYGLWSGLAEGDSPSSGTQSSAASGADVRAGEPTDDPAPSADAAKDEPGEQKARPGRSKDRSTTDGRDQEAADGAADGASDDGNADDGAASDEADDGGATVGTGAIVPTQPVTTAQPVPLDSVGDFGTGLVVRLSDMTTVQAEATAPGEIAGPAVRLTVEAVNDGTEPVSLDGVVVFLSYGEERSPASQFGSLSDPLAGELAADGSRTGSYVYAVPPDGRGDIRVEISYTGSAPTVAFEGAVA